jgi:hypothetical protein
MHPGLTRRIYCVSSAVQWLPEPQGVLSTWLLIHECDIGVFARGKLWQFTLSQRCRSMVRHTERGHAWADVTIIPQAPWLSYLKHTSNLSKSKPTRCNSVFIELVKGSISFGHQYAHLQELETIPHVVTSSRVSSSWKWAHCCPKHIEPFTSSINTELHLVGFLLCKLRQCTDKHIKFTPSIFE